MEYLVFLKIGLGLLGALTASIIIWSRRGSNKIERPLKDENGDYLIKKPEEIEDLNYDSEVTLEQSRVDAIKNPNGVPTVRPR